MILLNRRYAKILSLYQSSLYSLISKFVQHGQRNLEKENKNGQKLVLIMEFDQRN